MTQRDEAAEPAVQTRPAEDERAAQQQMPQQQSPLEGRVVGLAPGLFEVDVQGRAVLCTLRGRLRKQRPPAATRPPTPGRQPRQAPAEPEAPLGPPRVSIGDRVQVTLLQEGGGVIEDVLPRRNALTRARSEVGTGQVMLANLDQAILVCATAEPPPNVGLLDRALALCEHAGIPAVICCNKVDLGVSAEVRETLEGYAALGYPTLWTSATTGHGVPALRAQVHGRTSLLTGPSGVGKSSLMNVLVPEAHQRTGAISAATGEGRHTTTGARLLPLPDGGWLADSAGIRELALWRVPAGELVRCFVELRPLAGECAFEDCTHSAEEQDCALRGALAEGRISAARFASFLQLLEAAQQEEQPAWAARTR